MDERIERLKLAKEAMNRTVEMLLGWIRESPETMVDVEDFTSKCSRCMRRRARREGIIIQQNIDYVPFTWAHSTELEQVFLNILLNAVQHMRKSRHKSGIITIKTEFKPQEEMPIKIRFIDTGPGIHSRLLEPDLWKEEKIFHPMFTTKTKGTGMGLYISRGLLGNIGGIIRVERTAIMIGTTFLVELPVREGTEQMNNKQRVLVVDDIPKIRAQLRDSLEDAGYYVDEARNEKEAVKKVIDTEGTYNFVLMDQFLPQSEDGLRATQKIYEKFPELRVIILTQYGDGNYCREALDAHAYRYIFRPCPDEYVISVMQAADMVRELEETFKQTSLLMDIIENVGIGISIIDRTYRILYMNKKQKEILKPECRVGGICWIEYNNDVGRTSTCPWCPTKPAMETENTSVSVTISPKDGKLHYYTVVASPIFGRNGKVIGAIEFVRDITEQHLADRTTFEANEARTRLRAAWHIFVH